jgi:acyl carrier protein
VPHASSLENQISALFSEKLNVEVPSPDTNLIDTGLVDSLTFVEFLAHLEADFAIQVDLADLEIEHFQTITRIARFVISKGRPEAATSGRDGA